MPSDGKIEHTFLHPWRYLSLAVWVKFPSAKRPDLVSVDVLDKRLDVGTGRLHVKRLVIIEGIGYPAWLRKLLGSSVGFFVEHTVVDAQAQWLEMKSDNLTFDRVLKLTETCRYEPMPGNERNATLFTQTANVTSLIIGMQTAIEFACVHSFQNNATKGRLITEEAVQRVRAMHDERRAR